MPALSLTTHFRHNIFRSISILCFIVSTAGIADEVDTDSSGKILDFQEAYCYALSNNIKTVGVEVEWDIKGAERLQVGLYPNPELNISVDGPSNGNWNDTGNDVSIWLTQLFELGGKRRARVRVADAVLYETCWALQMAKCDLYADVMHAFINVAVAQEKLNLTKDFQNIAEQSLDCLSNKSNYGKISALDAKKAEIALKMAKLAYNKRFAELQKTKTELAALWNSNHPDFASVSYELFNIVPPLPYHQLADELENNPELSRAHAEVSKAWEILALERTKRIPNMAIYLGVSTTRNFHDPALSFGLSIPLPIFDRNQGNIARADHELNQVMLKQTDLINRLKVRMKILYREWNIAYQQAADLKEILDTVASERYKLTEERYLIGHSDFLDFLDARTTYFNIKQEYLDAVEEYHHKRAEVMQLLAKCCSEVLT